MVFENLRLKGHEMVCFGWRDKVRAIIAIHSTKLGPACGGIRMWKYPDEESALKDALRLAEAMTLKSAVAGLNLGGGKCVIMGDPEKDKSEEMFLALGEFVDALGGTYIAAEDVGIKPEDLVILSRRTKHVVGLPPEMGGMGDCSPYTALGVFHSIKVALEFLFGSFQIEGRRFVVQGLGKVGLNLAKLLLSEGGIVYGSDVSPQTREKAEGLGVKLLPPEETLFWECDVLAPCALGGVLNGETVPKLRCKIVCGGANNQLERDEVALLLQEKGILYIPDFLANAGGIISLSVEMEGNFSEERAREKVEGIAERVRMVLERHRKEGVTPLEASLRIARERLGE